MIKGYDLNFNEPKKKNYSSPLTLELLVVQKKIIQHSVDVH